MKLPRKQRGAAIAAIAFIAVAGCGSSGSKQDKHFLGQVNDICFSSLSRVYQAADTTKTNAPRDDVLAQAQSSLAAVADRLDGLTAPSDKRGAVVAVATQMRSSSQAIGRYLNDKQTNEPATSGDWNTLLGQLSELEQTAAGRGMRACSLPQQT